MDTASGAPAGIAFGRFVLLPQRRELLADGRPVKLGGRAFDVLMALIEARGAVVSTGRGYQFTAEIDTAHDSPKADPGTAISAAQPELPPTNPREPIAELIGRDDVLGEILSLASAHRLVTLTGAGGIGKTRSLSPRRAGC